MPLGAELESAWIGDCVRYLRERGLGTIEPIPDAEKRWDREVAELANATLYPLTDSWSIVFGTKFAGSFRFSYSATL
jgi:cyclohexanone monooxygenase